MRESVALGLLLCSSSSGLYALHENCIGGRQFGSDCSLGECPGFRKSCPLSLRTNVSSHPNVLFPPMIGSCSRTAVSNSSSRSNSWRSTTNWYSISCRWTTSWRSLLASELASDSMSLYMAVTFHVPALATGGLSLTVQRGSYLGRHYFISCG